MMPTGRLPRFRRAAARNRIGVTPRDLTILSYVSRHRFLRSPDLVGLVGGSTQPILRRLQRLYHGGYLDRPRAQLDYFHRGGSRVMVYGLTPKGGSLLRKRGVPGFPTHQKRGSVRPVGRLFLEHCLLVSDILVRLELWTRIAPSLRLIPTAELEVEGRRDTSTGTPHWTVRLGLNGRVGVIPDAAFGLEIQHPKSLPSRILFFLEGDRGTMPIERRKLAQSSILRKLRAYEATWLQGIHRSRFGFNRFRVLTITSSRARRDRMAKAANGLGRCRGLFLFTDVESLRTASSFNASIWHGCDGGRAVPLIPEI